MCCKVWNKTLVLENRVKQNKAFLYPIWSSQLFLSSIRWAPCHPSRQGEQTYMGHPQSVNNTGIRVRNPVTTIPVYLPNQSPNQGGQSDSSTPAMVLISADSASSPFKALRYTTIWPSVIRDIRTTLFTEHL